MYVMYEAGFKRARSQRSPGFSEIVLKNKIAMKFYEAVLYTSMN